jgi:hypothetical protein
VTVVTVLWPSAINSLLGQSYSIERSLGGVAHLLRVGDLSVLGVMVLLGVVSGRWAPRIGGMG